MPSSVLVRTSRRLSGSTLFISILVAAATPAFAQPAPAAPGSETAAPPPELPSTDGTPLAPTAPSAQGTAPSTAPEATDLRAVPPPAPEQSGDKPVAEASFGKGATIRSADDKFSLNIRARIQARASVTETDGDGEGPVTGLQIRRMRVVFQGNALGPDLTYYIQLAFSNLDMESDLRSPLRDAYFTWAIARDANLRVGQMKVPYGRQRVVSSSAQQFVDRSIVVSEFNLDRDVGLHMFSKDLFGWGGKLGYSLAVFGGDGRNRIADKFGLLYAARVQVTPMGTFDDYEEADLKRVPSPKLALGVNAAYNQNTNRPRSTFGEPYPGARFDYLHAGVDVLLKWRGLSVSAEWLYRRADRGRRSVDVDGELTPVYSRSGWGAFGQVGQMLTERLEVLMRYGFLKPLAGADPELTERQELGGGLSYYLRAHNLKVQTDYFYLPVRTFADGRHEVRLQAQVYY